MSYVRVTGFDIAILLKLQSSIEHDYNLTLGIQSIAFSLSFGNNTDCLALMLACLNGHGRRNFDVIQRRTSIKALLHTHEFELRVKLRPLFW